LTVINGGFSLHMLHRSSSFGPRGFLLHTVTRLFRPRLFSTIRGSATLCPLPALVFPLRFSFLAPSGDLGARTGGQPFSKAYDFPTYRPAPHRFDMPDIWSCPFASARPSPRCHLAGSLFATYAVLPHASDGGVQPDPPFLTMPLPCWCAGDAQSFRPVTVGSFTSGGYTKRSVIVPCQAHTSYCSSRQLSLIPFVSQVCLFLCQLSH
jgi:hypothetical protein